MTKPLRRYVMPKIRNISLKHVNLRQFQFPGEQEV
jgi:hypothetical protein